MSYGSTQKPGAAPRPNKTTPSTRQLIAFGVVMALAAFTGFAVASKSFTLSTSASGGAATAFSGSQEHEQGTLDHPSGYDCDCPPGPWYTLGIPFKFSDDGVMSDGKYCAHGPACGRGGKFCHKCVCGDLSTLPKGNCDSQANPENMARCSGGFGDPLVQCEATIAPAQAKPCEDGGQVAWTQCNFNSKACGGEYSKHAHRDEDKFYNQGFHDNCVCDTGYHLQCDSDKDRKNCECTKIKIQEKSDPAGFARGYEHVGIGVCDPDIGKRFTGKKSDMGMPICTNECSSHGECNCGVVSECMEDWKTGSGNRVNAGEKCLGCGDCKPCCDDTWNGQFLWNLHHPGSVGPVGGC